MPSHEPQPRAAIRSLTPPQCPLTQPQSLKLDPKTTPYAAAAPNPTRPKRLLTPWILPNFEFSFFIASLFGPSSKYRFPSFDSCFFRSRIVLVVAGPTTARFSRDEASTRSSGTVVLLKLGEAGESREDMDAEGCVARTRTGSTDCSVK